MENERLELLTRIASMYFEQGLTQKQIADLTGYSRSMVSRLLTEAREQQLVEIRVHHSLGRRHDLEIALQHTLGLRAARVLERGTLNYSTMTQHLGALSARLIEELVHDGMTIGVSWGRTVLETVNALRFQPLADIHVVQIVGLLGTEDPLIDGNEIARRLARAFNGRYSVLPAPLIVDSQATRDALLEDHRVRRVLDSARPAELALLGIGTLELAHCTLVHDGYMTEGQVHDLTATGAVGDICCTFFDSAGRILDTDLSRRVVAIDPPSLREIPTKVAVAGGQAKVAPILGAVLAGLVDILVTDEIAASGVLDEVRAKKDTQDKVLSWSD